MTWSGRDRRDHGFGNRARRLIVGSFLAMYGRQWEVSVGWILLVVGVWLILPVATFPSAAGYAWMEEIGLPEWGLGLALLIVGLFGLASGMAGPRRMRSAALLAMVGTNVFLAVAYYMGSASSLGVAIFAALAIIAAVATIYVEWAAQWTSHREL